jgi:hypothetical protein
LFPLQPVVFSQVFGLMQVQLSPADPLQQQQLLEVPLHPPAGAAIPLQGASVHVVHAGCAAPPASAAAVNTNATAEEITSVARLRDLSDMAITPLDLPPQ